jgi:enoyl-CoA hydratase/carnithine racemase
MVPAAIGEDKGLVRRAVRAACSGMQLAPCYKDARHSELFLQTYRPFGKLYRDALRATSRTQPRRCVQADHSDGSLRNGPVSDEEILYEVADRIATVTLNRPTRLNAWTPKMEQEVAAAITRAERDPAVVVIILTGAGRGFCAGADMQNLDNLAGANLSATELKERFADRLRGTQRAGARPDFQKTYSYFPAVTKPIIAAINGPAVGLGLVIALYCDIRFASDSAKFGTAFSRRGLIAEHGMSWMLPRLVGISNALDLLYSARLIDAAEALRIGLVSRVLPSDGLQPGVRAYAAELASQVSPRSLRVMKKQVYDALFQSLDQAIDVANEEMVKSFASADFREGVSHFLEKRPPRFTGE